MINGISSILEYLNTNERITNSMIQELCGFSRQQARIVIDKMKNEELIELMGKGVGSYYVKR